MSAIINPAELRTARHSFDAQHMEATLDAITMLRAFQGARRLARRKRDRNWIFAMEMFGIGSTYAWGMCNRMGIDPDGFTADPLPHPAGIPVRRVPTPETEG